VTLTESSTLLDRALSLLARPDTPPGSGCSFPLLN